VGIGGCGFKVAQEFLGNVDLDLSIVSRLTKADYTTMGGIKGIWIESNRQEAVKQNFFKDLNKDPIAYPGFFIPHDKIQPGSPVHKKVSEIYGFDLKKQGYVRAAQYLKSIYEIFENDESIYGVSRETLGSSNPIFESSWKAISQYTTLAGGKCEGILFIISLGGGTGTGFVNPIVKNIRDTGTKDYLVFALGVLTEEQDELSGQQQDLPKRNLGATISIYDLVTKRDGVDGLIIFDNQILCNKFGTEYGTYNAVNSNLYQIMRPLVAGRYYPSDATDGQAVATNLREGTLQPPLLVPCYSSRKRRGSKEADLVNLALDQDGRYMGCDPTMAEKVFVFCRGFFDIGKIETAIREYIPTLDELDARGNKKKNINVWRKLSDDRVHEMLILLRNPFGSPGAYERAGTLEWRLHRVISSAIDYLKYNRGIILEEIQDPEAKEDETVKLTKVTRDALESYFYGENGLLRELDLARIRLEKGERGIFRRPISIFDGGRSPGRESSSLGIDDAGLTDIQRDQIQKMIQEKFDAMGFKA
jgi:hypothetical protein